MAPSVPRLRYLYVCWSATMVFSAWHSLRADLSGGGVCHSYCFSSVWKSRPVEKSLHGSYSRPLTSKYWRASVRCQPSLPAL
ncbi:hypothetical protein PR001_g22748 [Phytophthora rubi]|uniref:Uncharacterized protein n=1 Tax=Phytophthora rubi TaxID=129364 RepID=A0A6A3IUV6_9STRA|nr:hypothetical protein PR001_g22748 [Phytophthora rubi]